MAGLEDIPELKFFDPIYREARAQINATERAVRMAYDNAQRDVLKDDMELLNDAEKKQAFTDNIWGQLEAYASEGLSYTGGASEFVQKVRAKRAAIGAFGFDRSTVAQLVDQGGSKLDNKIFMTNLEKPLKTAEQTYMTTAAEYLKVPEHVAPVMKYAGIDLAKVIEERVNSYTLFGLYDAARRNGGPLGEDSIKDQPWYIPSKGRATTSIWTPGGEHRVS